MPQHPSLARLDLNLLVSLDALLTERSVTRAAERLHLSQPALSASLARLRAHFGDEILARRGNTYELTPLAVRLAEHTSLALDAARRVFEAQAEWTPSTSNREFTIYGSDYGLATIGAAASRIASRRAPGVSFRFVLHNTALVDDAATTLRSADFMVIPHGYLTDLPHQDLWRDRWVILAADTNEAAAEGLDMALLEELPWVFTYRSRTAFTAAGRQLQLLGINPKVEVVAETFLAIPEFLHGTNRLAIIQGAIVPNVLRLGGLRAFEPPFDATPTVNALWWHPVHDRDPEHAWMRSIFAEAATEVAAGSHAAARYTPPRSDISL